MRVGPLALTVLFFSGLALAGCEAGVEPAGSADPHDWPQWRGPHRDGHSGETGLVEAWPEGGPSVEWRKPIGPGFSGIAVADGRAFTAWAEGGDEVLVALDAATGEEKWRRRLDATFEEEFGNGPRATPTCAGDVVYAMSSRARLYAVRSATGDELWRRDLFSELVDPRIPYGRGYASSPLVEDELLLLQVGPSPGSAIVALDRRDGSIVWRAHGGRAAFSSPIAATLRGERQIVSATAFGLLGLLPATGEIRWAFRWQTPNDLNIATPVFVEPDRFLLSSGYDTGAVLVGVGKMGEKWGTAAVWTQKHFRNHFNSSVYHEGFLYGFDNAILKSIDAATGEERWKARGFGKGSLIAADGKLIVLGENGHLGLVRASAESYEELARARVLSGKCWTPPGLAQGRLFLRNHEEIVVLRLR